MDVESPAAPQPMISRNRLEFLFDGIFAIAMTILVLELRVPDLADRHSVAELGRFLLHHGPTFVSYLLSFIMLGILWYDHNQQFRHLRRITRSILTVQLLQLAAAAFFPFCAALFGRYPTNFLTISIYTGCIMVCRWCSLALWLLAKRCGVFAPDMDPSVYPQLRKGNIRACAITTGLFLVYLFNALVHG